jgi:nucleotidyltransferase-like protein
MAIDLDFRTGNEMVDAGLHRVVNRLEQDFPRRVVGYYLRGSFADGTANDLSDVDLAVVTKEVADSLSVSRAIQWVAPSWPTFETVALSVSQLNDRNIADLLVGIKWGSQLLHGEEVRERIIPQEHDYTRAVIRQCRAGIAMLRDAVSVQQPLNYPDPDGQFFGYEATVVEGKKAVRKLRWYRPGTTEGTKEFASVVARCATGLVAVRGGPLIARRADVIPTYSAAVADEWTEFVRAVHVACRETWAYRVPTEHHDRTHLRDLCRRMPDFERHSLRSFSGW